MLSSRTACANRGSFSSPELGQSVGDLVCARAGREVGEIARPALGLRDDGARHADHVGVAVGPLGDERGEIVAGADFGEIRDG